MPNLDTGFLLLAIVLIVSALASGFVVRAPISFPIIFLGIGVLVGERGLDLIRIAPDSAVLEVIAIVSLSLVLFIDAVKLRLDELRDGWLLPFLTTVPGTLLTIALIAAAMLIMGQPLLAALLIGAALSSLDPVVVRDVVRDRRIPNSIRQTLSLEGGTNDVVVLPSILILIAISGGLLTSAGDWLSFLGRLFVLGPVAGFAVGAAGSWAMARVSRRYPVPREYEALYGVGLVFAAFVGGELVGGSGFLAAFMAGFAVVVFNNELCECFVEYGEVTAEMAMLLAFILLGAALSTLVDQVAWGRALLFALFVLAVARPLVITLVLARARVSRAARLFIAFFGPRGLNSLLLVLLVIHAGVPGAEGLMAIVGVVVVISVVVHGAAATPLGAWYERRRAGTVLPEERESTPAGLFQGDADDVPRVAVPDLVQRLAGAAPPLVLDVRTEAQERRDGARIPGSVRVLPDDLATWAAGQIPTRPVVAYCT